MNSRLSSAYFVLKKPISNQVVETTHLTLEWLHFKVYYIFIYIYIFFLLNDHNINIFWMIHFFPIKIMSKFVVFITIIHQTAKNCCRKNITKPQIFTKPVKIKSLPKNQNVKKSNYVISNVISTQKSSRHQ